MNLSFGHLSGLRLSHGAAVIVTSTERLWHLVVGAGLMILPEYSSAVRMLAVL
jgi:hypothetical protein